MKPHLTLPTLALSGIDVRDTIFIMKKNLTIIIGEPFEEEWTTEYSIFDKDRVDARIPFVIRNSYGESVLDINLENGLMIAQLTEEEFSRAIVSIYETEILEVGEYTYEYHGITLSGKKIIDIEGTITVKENKELNKKEKRDVRPWDLFRSSNTPEGARVTEEIQKKRYDICKGCPDFISLTSQCKRCGCFMKHKSKLSAASCPIGKWLPEVQSVI